jgi:GT2 family glycosyltransferase/lipopolysaccharide/colanic/teichoic acid biosynthesis glycosyltransferase
VSSRGGSFDLSIVIVGYNSRPDLDGCLRAIEASLDAVTSETIVIDNASSDGTVSLVKREFKWVRLFENSSNVGLARAVNRGIREAKGHYVLVLNPDIQIRSGSLDALVAFMDSHSDVGMAGAKLLNTDGSLQYSCRAFYTFWTLVLRRTFLGTLFKHSRTIQRHLMLDYDHETPREVDWILGACMLTRRDALADVGPMDERFFLYFEDVDWCYRMWRGGWKVCYVPASVMTHRHARESAGSGISRQLVSHLLSLAHFYEKWGGFIYALKRHRRILRTSLLLISDVVAINAGFAFAYLLRSSLRGLLAKPLFGVEIYGAFLVFSNIMFLVTFAFFGLYHGRQEREPWADTFLRLTRASAVAAIILMASTFLASTIVYSRLLVGAFSLLVVILASIQRGGLRLLHNQIRAGSFDLARVAVVGTGRTAVRLAERIASRPALGYDLVGLVDPGLGKREPSAIPVIGMLENLIDLVDAQRLEEIIFADPELPNSEISDFLLRARRSTVDVRLVSGLTGIMTQRARVEEFLDTPVVTFEREALLGTKGGVKRALDIGGAAVLLTLWSPILAVSALVSKATRGRGPITRSVRAGRNQVEYQMLTLHPEDAESALRRFIVRHGLNGFPALVNVLRGDMSLVGPEPLVPAVADRCDTRSRVRFDARPGIVGLARIAGSGTYSGDDAATRDDSATALDAYYVQNWSLGSDLRIVLRWLLRCAGGRSGY